MSGGLASRILLRMSADAPIEPDAVPTPARRPPPAELAAWGLLLVLLALTTLARRVGAAPPLLVATAVLLPALWALVLVVEAGLAAHLRTLRGAAPAAVVLLGLLGVWGRTWVGVPARGDGAPLRVLSWNVQRLGWEDAATGPRVDCVVARVEEVDPDALVLLEVSARDVARLSDRLDLDCVHTDYRGTGIDKHGGVAACARGGRWRLARNGPRRFTEEHDWYYVFGELVRAGAPDDPDAAAPGDIFNLVGVHLQPYGGVMGAHLVEVSEAQRDETAALLARVAQLRDPTVVAGDFNSARDAPVHVAMRGWLTDAFEQAGWGYGATARAAGWLPVRIDYVYATDTMPVKAARSPAWDCSDHRPVVADLVLKKR